MMSKEHRAVEKARKPMREEVEVISDLMDRDPEAGINAAKEWIGEQSRIFSADHEGIVNVRAAIKLAVANPNTKKEYADSLKELLEVMNKKLM